MSASLLQKFDVDEQMLRWGLELDFDYSEEIGCYENAEDDQSVLKEH
jgi:hypothetical protein